MAFSRPSPYNLTVVPSRGNQTLSAADQTLVTDDAPATLPWPYTEPSLGEAFQGAAPAKPIDVATYTQPNSTNGLYYPVLTYRWNSITIPAGGEVAFLHFATQQTSQGQASARRPPGQAPPEGLAGLQLDELAPIQNFVTGTITATLYSGCAVTATMPLANNGDTAAFKLTLDPTICTSGGGGGTPSATPQPHQQSTIAPSTPSVHAANVDRKRTPPSPATLSLLTRLLP